MCSPALCRPINQLRSKLSAALKSHHCPLLRVCVCVRCIMSPLWRTTLSSTYMSQAGQNHFITESLPASLSTHISTLTHTGKPLKTQSQWTQTSSLVYCFNMCRRSRHCEKSYGSASIGCDEQRR